MRWDVVSKYIASMIVAGFTVYLMYSEMGPDAFSARGALPVLVGMSLYFVILFSLEAVFDRADTQARLKAIDAQSKPTKTAMERVGQTSTGSAIENWIFKIQRSIRLSSGSLPEIRQRLVQAGFFKERDLVVYILMRVALPAIGGMIGVLGLLISSNKMTGVLWILLGTAAGYYGIELFIRWKTRVRHRVIWEEMPDFLDTFVIYTESGQSFDSALVYVIENMRARYPTTASEMRVLEREMRLMPERKKAFDSLVGRCNMDLMKRFVDILKQSEEMGSPISESLKFLADDTRKERMLEAERRAAKIPVKIQFPIALFILPAMFIFIMTPAGIRIYETLSRIVLHH